jgi:hypothetical protein
LWGEHNNKSYIGLQIYVMILLSKKLHGKLELNMFF